MTCNRRRWWLDSGTQLGVQITSKRVVRSSVGVDANPPAFWGPSRRIPQGMVPDV